MARIAVFGATSGIAKAVALKLMTEGEDLVLIGRSREALMVLALELEKATGRSAPYLVWDVLDFGKHGERFGELVKTHAIKGLFFAAGVLVPQEECDRDPAKTQLTLDSNLTGPTMIIGLFVEYFLGQANQVNQVIQVNQNIQAKPFISCISSVAGDRGRGKVLAYAASKAGLSAYLAGLRHRLVGSGILVQTIKPGFVKTRMVGKMQSPLMASPEYVAAEIIAAIRKRREVLYTPFYWRYIMAIIKAIPEPIFKKMKF
jgi:decaprenylphospho-beta-D-erythro-pentofuranosid-2-ulose 2-reductase